MNEVLSNLEKALLINQPSLLEQDGIVFRFRQCVDHLTYNLLKMSVPATTPREAIQKMIQEGINLEETFWFEVFAFKGNLFNLSLDQQRIGTQVLAPRFLKEAKNLHRVISNSEHRYS